MERNIYLVGMMGAGKTTVGRQLAKRLGRRFVDADQEIEARTGVAVETVFEIEGEAGFRAREAQVVRDLAAQSGLVVATGGGVVLDAANRQQLTQSGLVIYLHAPPTQLYQRTRRDQKRPLLRVADPLAKIIALCEARDPLYREIADIVVEPQMGGAIAQVANIENELQKREPQ